MATQHQVTQAARYLDYGGAFFHAKHPEFKAAGDGTTDDAPALNYLFTALKENGGRGVIPPGKYRCASALDLTEITKGGVEIVGAPGGQDYASGGGADNRGTVILMDSDDLGVDATGSPGLVLRDLSLWDGVSGGPAVGILQSRSPETQYCQRQQLLNVQVQMSRHDATANNGNGRIAVYNHGAEHTVYHSPFLVADLPFVATSVNTGVFDVESVYSTVDTYGTTTGMHFTGAPIFTGYVNAMYLLGAGSVYGSNLGFFRFMASSEPYGIRVNSCWGIDLHGYMENWPGVVTADGVPGANYNCTLDISQSNAPDATPWLDPGDHAKGYQGQVHLATTGAAFVGSTLRARRSPDLPVIPAATGLDDTTGIRGCTIWLYNGQPLGYPYYTTGTVIDEATGRVTQLGASTVLGGITSTVRDGLASPPDGMMIYNATTKKHQARANGVWVDLY